MSFLVFHPSWGYFAKEFALNQVAVEIEGREPSPKELKRDYRSREIKACKSGFYTTPDFQQNCRNPVKRA